MRLDELPVDVLVLVLGARDDPPPEPVVCEDMPPLLGHAAPPPPPVLDYVDLCCVARVCRSLRAAVALQHPGGGGSGGVERCRLWQDECVALLIRGAARAAFHELARDDAAALADIQAGRRRPSSSRRFGYGEDHSPPWHLTAFDGYGGALRLVGESYRSAGPADAERHCTLEVVEDGRTTSPVVIKSLLRATRALDAKGFAAEPDALWLRLAGAPAEHRGGHSGGKYEAIACSPVGDAEFAVWRGCDTGGGALTRWWTSLRNGDGRPRTTWRLAWSGMCELDGAALWMDAVCDLLRSAVATAGDQRHRVVPALCAACETPVRYHDDDYAAAILRKMPDSSW